ncbi:MAG TPA: sucrose synthase [Longimicrobiales bacterium]|nr:sucrose synthase [Longimicrobiales bacterium]
MIDALHRSLEDHREALYLFFRHLRESGGPVLPRSDVQHVFRDFREGPGPDLPDPRIAALVAHTQEVVVQDSQLFFAVRERVAHWRYLHVHTEEMEARELTVSEFLGAKERAAVGAPRGAERYALEVDLSPFERGFPKLQRVASIGRGVEFLNRHLSSRLFGGQNGGLQRLVDFLRVHEVQGRPLLLNGSVESVPELKEALREGIAVLGGRDPEGDGFCRELRQLGFEQGWGRTAARARDTMEILSDLLEAPSAGTLEDFLARVPMIFSIAILSPHGFFAQSDVLGMPDTGGQVVYILDQVRALERTMRASIREAGLDVEPRIVVLTRLIPEARGTTCDTRLEPILGTENATILRVPFRSRDGDVVPRWISRFEIWPYLERYAVDAQRELLAELGGRPDFLIGNYSDGNLVASIMAHRMGVTQCNIAHALEKTKYRDSDLRWKEQEGEHHFSCQYTADLIAMNTADFIITSTYQEIAGTQDTVGQYESYRSFTMPGLYRVVAGIDCFDPKFNIVSPGADPRVFFPWHEEERRLDEVREEIREMVFGGGTDGARGHLAEPERPLLFAMSRLDRIKNVAGLLSAYGASDALRARANLLIIGGHVDPDRSNDRDERAQIETIHGLFDRYELDGEVRWLQLQTDKNRVGEFYRVVADTGGAFVQPALFEAFGLTVVEAMSTGLPTFATCHGGPREIVEDGVSGYHVDPAEGDAMVEPIVRFFREMEDDPELWARISRGAMERVRERYNWLLYARTLLKLSRIYGFWRFITSLEREETRRYLEMFYGLMYRPRARALEGDGVDGSAEDGTR